MSYNRENNIDDLIALTTEAEETYYLVLEDYDGRGALSNPPYLYGLSQVVHILRRNELHKTVQDLLQQYPEGCQFFESKDEYNLMTDKNVRVTPSDTLEKVFGDEKRAVLYLQNRACSHQPLLQEEQGKKEMPETMKRFNWGRCIIIFSLCWILKFFLLFGIIVLLKSYQIL